MTGSWEDALDDLSADVTMTHLSTISDTVVETWGGAA